MFERLKSKLKYSIVIYILISTTIMFMSIIFYTNYVLINDIQLKTAQLNKQYSNSIATQLDRIVKTETLFLAKNHVVEILKSKEQNLYLAGNLSDLNYSTNTIIGGTIVTKDIMYYQDTKLSDYALSKIFPPNCYEYFSKNIKEPTWIFKDTVLGGVPVAYFRGILFHITPIKSDDETLGYMVVSSHIPEIFKDFQFENNSFLKNANIYLYNFDKEIYPVYEHSKSPKIDVKIADKIAFNTTEVKNFTSLTVYNKIENSNIGLCVYLPSKYAMLKNGTTNLLMILSFLIIILLCLLTQKSFINGITAPLTALLNKMNQYIKNKKS